VGALKGPKHGGANIRVADMFDDIKANVKDWKDEDEVAGYLGKILRKEAFDKKGLVYGIGHAVYTLSDPRAVIMRNKAEELACEKSRVDEYKLFRTVEQCAPRVVAEVKQQNKPMAANVDFYSGFVYSMLNIPRELYTPIFAISRIAGWSAHRIEEIISGGKIIRPAYKSVCKKSHYVPINKRK
jgi:citrate synthase